MKRIFTKILMALTVVAGVFTSCQDVFDESTSLDLYRFLEPMNLSAKVTNGDEVTFNWDITEGADMFALEVYADSLMTDMILSEELAPDQIPYTRKLTADSEYWFRVQAKHSEGVREASKWAVCEKSIKTYAVASNLFLKVADRTANTLSVTWTADPEVDRLEYSIVGSETVMTKDLTSDEIAAGAAVITDLVPSTNYIVSLYYLSANRGEIDLWTMPSVDGATEVADAAALLKAIADKAPKIYVKAAGSPYEMGAVDLVSGVEIYGEESADGVRPTINGEFHIADTYAGGAIYLESVEMNGNGDSYGFPIQLKNGGKASGLAVESIIFRNCDITGYSKGLIYEWSQTMTLGELTFENCHIHKVNAEGIGGGDGIDLRNASTINKLNVVNNTIQTGFRTFLRIDPAVILGEVKVENNTMMNICFSDNTNNGGILAFQAKPSTMTFKNNIILNETGKATLTTENDKYIAAADLGVAVANNHFYSVPETFFTSKFSQADALAGKGSILAADPCFNSKGGYFNLVNADLAVAKAGASKWWVEYVEEVEDLTLPVTETAHTWDFADAKYFSGEVTKSKVRDNLLMSVAENKLNIEEGVINFTQATTLNKKGLPVDGYVAFKVNKPGSVYINAYDAANTGNHLVVATGTEAAGNITVKGGVTASAHGTTNQKILISDITEETIVYVYASGPIGLSALAWAFDLEQVNTALKTPAPEADAASFTAGEAVDVTVSWQPVPNAGSYSVVFKGKTYAVEASDAPAYMVEGKTTSMLDPGSYTVEVYANPAEGDIYNTMSDAGKAAFAVLPKADAGGADILVVKDAESLLAAIGAGKPEIYLAEGNYEIGTLEVIAPLSLIGQGNVTVNGAFKPSGEVGSFKLSNLTFVDVAGAGCFITLPETGVTASEIVVENCVLDGFSKSVIYGNYETANIDKIVFDGVQTKNWGTGQGIFDFRKGTYGSIIIKESTITGGRDLIRLDSGCNTGEVVIRNNTFDGVNNGVNGNGMLYVRKELVTYKVIGNLFLNQTADSKNTIWKTSGVQIPYMAKNFFYNCIDAFFIDEATKALAVGNNGVILESDPVKDAANGDYTLTSALAMSCKVGAKKWNPSYAAGDDTCFTVTSADEFQSAIDAGKTDIKFAMSGSPYDLSAENITIAASMHVNGEVVNGEYPVIKIKQIDLLPGVETLVFENLAVEGDGANNIFNVKEAIAAKQIVIRNNIISKAGKSIFYDNVGGAATSIVIRNNIIKELGGGQGTIDMRKSSVVNLSIENNTVIGGRDFLRADKTTVTGGINVDNNTFDGVTLNHGNGIFHVRAEGINFSVKRNLFLNENGENNLMAKAGDQVPVMSGNFYYNCTSEKFFAGAIDQATATGNGGVILSADPVKDAANGDYTLVDALCLSSNVGAAHWNPNAGRVTTDITVSSLEELINALDAGKTNISLNAGTYDFTAAPETATSFSSGVLTVNASLALKGISKAGVKPVVIGGIKFVEGVTSFTAQGIAFNGNEKAVGNAFEVAGALDATNIIFRDCEIYGYNKSLFYGNAEGKVNNLTFNRLLVHDMGTGQGMIDIRKQLYAAVVVENSTFYNGGRDFIRLDGKEATTVSSAAIRNNTFAAVSIDAANSLLYVRSVGLGEKYVVENNLFLNETGETTILAKSGTQVPVMKNNWFYNCTSAAFWNGPIDQTTATGNGGGVLEADPCAASADANFKLVNNDMKNAKVGDPRWW